MESCLLSLGVGGGKSEHQSMLRIDYGWLVTPTARLVRGEVGKVPQRQYSNASPPLADATLKVKSVRKTNSLIR
ncbi:MAG: hypothetical protein WDZ39_00570, partial [Candidatus Spechtbacterales bacterium]